MKIWVDRSKELVGENIHLIPTILVQHQVENKDILLGNGCINSPSLRFCQDIGLSILRSPYFAQTSLQAGYCTSGSPLAGFRVCNDRENTEIILFIFIVVFSIELIRIELNMQHLDTKPSSQKVKFKMSHPDKPYRSEEISPDVALF